MSTAVASTCPYCGVGCGVRATATGAQSATIAGDAAHPANRGKLCVKGAALGETLGLEGRLLYPQRRTSEQVRQRVSWDHALNLIAQTFAQTIAAHGPDSVALYVSGQLLTEDYYVANKLMKGYIGSANIDTNSRLCMSSAVAGHKRAFGEDVVPVDYADFDEAELIVLVGSNTAWCHPVLYQRMLAAKQARPELQIVVIDPRRTATCESADLHLPIQPGTDVWLFNGLLAYLHQHGIVDAAFVAAHTEGAAAAVEMAERSTGSLAHVARTCGLSEDALRRYYALFARSARVITVYSQGVNQSSAGSDKVNSIINCHLLTGRIAKPGAGPFSVTGQPNAMGGREVGGLANQLAAHLDLENAQHRALVQGYWQSPRIAERAGYKAVELFEAIHDGRIKAVWIIGTNPVVSLPDADRARAALARCPFVVVSDVIAETDTTQLAHLLLPALAWGEKDGTVTNSERCISRQRAFLPPPGEAQPDWWALAEVAKRMGYGAGFEHRSSHEIFVEHAGLSAYEQEAIPRVFDIGALAALSAGDYAELSPLQWPVPAAASPSHVSRLTSHVSRPYADGRYSHADGRARLLPLRPRAPANLPDDDYPMVLNSGRLRDQWHTMTRSGRAPTLSAHRPEPEVEIHPYDAMLWGVQHGRLARVSTRWGACVLRVRSTDEQPRRQLFAPIHWNDQTASDARVGRLVNPVVDPVSGEPEFKHTPARIEPFFVAWYGFVLTRTPLASLPNAGLAWWSRIQGKAFIRYELAGRGPVPDWSEWSRALLGAQGDSVDWLDARDDADGSYRAAQVDDDGALAACVLISPRSEELPARAWLSGLFAQAQLEEADRMSLLAGQPALAGADPGATVCACFGVGRNTILCAIREQALRTPEALTARLKCGGNCGSCIPELKALIAQAVSED